MKQLIILAAGQGTRLGPWTKEIPKCMVPVGGKPILQWQILAAQALGVEKIVVVCGYRKEKIRFPGIITMENPEFASTNMVSTLWCARDHFGEGFVMSYGDILYTPKVLESLFQNPKDVSVIVDKDWLSYWTRRFENVLQDAESLTLNEQGCITRIGQKVSSTEAIQGQYIGLVGFRGPGVGVLQSTLERLRTKAPEQFQRMYMTDLLQELIACGQPLHAVTIRGGWLEIDSPKDLELANDLVEAQDQRLIIKR